jgi:hypothetical protein
MEQEANQKFCKHVDLWVTQQQGVRSGVAVQNTAPGLRSPDTANTYAFLTKWCFHGHTSFAV